LDGGLLGIVLLESNGSRGRRRKRACEAEIGLRSSV
jgi:hypothetical protein